MNYYILNLPISIGTLSALGLFVFGIIALMLKRRGKNVPTSLVYMVIIYTIGIILATYANTTDKNDWAKISFEGKIIEKRVTNNHGMIQFVVQDQDAAKRYILDTLWKMKEFNIGDYVTKSSESMEVHRK